MSQEITTNENQNDIGLLKIEEVQFKYTKVELTSGCGWGNMIGNNPSYKKYKDSLKDLSEKRERRKSKSYKNRDYFIKGLEKLLENPTIENSLKIWNTLSKAHESFLFAVYIPNEAFNKKFGRYDKQYDSYINYKATHDSRIAHLIKKYKWIPDKEGNFHKPCEPNFYRENVHSDFNFNNQFFLA